MEETPPPIRSKVDGRYVKGSKKNYPDELRCEAMRTNGFRCKQHFSVIAKSGKKFCRFHDRRFGARARKNEWKRQMALQNYKAMGDILEALFTEGKENTSEAAILSCIDEVVLMRKSVEPILGLSARILCSKDASIEQKNIASVSMQTALKKVVDVVAVATKVRESIKTTITVDQVRDITGQIVRLVSQVFGSSPELLPKVEEFNRRLYLEVRMPQGVVGEGDTNPEVLIDEMEALTLG